MKPIADLFRCLYDRRPPHCTIHRLATVICSPKGRVATSSLVGLCANGQEYRIGRDWRGVR
ncbi:hypothetical protein L249_4036, partial [Ophiocordyceps polyrhachis-furcata BCC 54312]